MVAASQVFGILALIMLTVGCKDSDHSTRSAMPVEAVAIPASNSATAHQLDDLEADAGDVVGVVGVDSTISPLKPIDVSSCTDCLKLHPDGIADETIVRSTEGALKNVIVCLKDDRSPTAAPEFAAVLPPAQLDQVGCRYEPHVVALQVGQQLNVISSDPVVHNVHGQAIDNPAFNFSDRQKTLTFRQPEIFPVRCDVHPWMKAWVAVFPSALFSVTDSTGSFRIHKVLPGRYTLQAWHERLGRLTRQVDVDSDKPLKISLVYSR